MKLEPTLQEWETDVVHSVHDSFQLTETQEDDEEGNEIDHEEGDESDVSDEKGVEGEGPRGGIPNVVLMEEFMIEREEFKKEREELKNERDKLKKERAEMRRKEALFDDSETLLRREKELFFVDKEWFFKDKEKLANEMEEFNKEKEGNRTQRGRNVMEEEGEELRKRVEVNDIEDKELGHVDLDVQSYSNVKGNVWNESTSHAVYERRAKRIPKTSYYKISLYLSLSAFDTTPGANKEKLANERDEFNKEKKGSPKQRRHFVMEAEGEESRNKVEVNDIEDKELKHASTSPPIYKWRTKRILKPSYYKVSPYLSLSVFDTTPGVVREPKQVTAFATSPISFPV
ncbi:uncharacterized protein LOC131249685 [Magnolia sinica]|uniref:uncharacterized protein LOC131249685 n=1 Tax=Magnolia sinica TaxID=86752 RepID=UPI002659AB5F|nr:uncharacterized protein LOC131249685 [Magnolia sinica]